MPITKPLKRNVRQFTDGHFDEGGRAGYIEHSEFSQDPEHYIRAFLIIQKDLLTLFDFIEPADKNLPTYSFRIHELLLRVCVEIEANFVAILSENGYSKTGNWTMEDYKKINITHRLSSYQIKLPVWNGQRVIRCPFENWGTPNALPWYKAYNETKHDRHSKFSNATFEHLTDAICGLVAVLSSQFYTHDFSPSDSLISWGGHTDGMESAIGNYFRVQFPTDWDQNGKYEFNWQQLETQNSPIDRINY
jgi:hypothetical protein